MINPTFYVFHGDDDLNMSEAVRKMHHDMGENGNLNTSEFDGTVASVPEIINAVSSFPFLSEKRLVIVKGMLAWITRRGAGQAGKNAVDQLTEALPRLPDHARLVFVERELLAEKHPILLVIKQTTNGFEKLFKTPQDITGWILRRARSEYDVEIDNDAAAALSQVIGDDLRRADNELIKLVSYIADRKRITEDDVVQLTPYVPEANIFKMVDAIAEGRGPMALELMHRLIDDKQQDAFSLFGMIVRQFRLLLIAKEHLVTGGAPGGVAKAAGVRPFMAQNLARQARDFSLEDLERIYRALQDFDLRMKTGRIEPNLALDLFVSSVTR